jgi:serine/threonine protein kinase
MSWTLQRAAGDLQGEREVSSTLQRAAGQVAGSSVTHDGDSDVDPVAFPFSTGATKEPAYEDEEPSMPGIKRSSRDPASQLKERESDGLFPAMRCSTTRKGENRGSTTRKGDIVDEQISPLPAMFQRPATGDGSPRPQANRHGRRLAAVGYSDAIDIWSFGILCLELAFGRPPDYDLSPAAVIYNRLQLPAPGPDNYEVDERLPLSRTFLDLVSRCLDKDPARRPSAKKLLKHAFFKKSRGASYLREHLLAHLPPNYLGSPPLIPVPSCVCMCICVRVT